jgi:hypothetical protein
MVYMGFVKSDGQQLLSVGCHGERMSAAVVTRCNYKRLAWGEGGGNSTVLER